MIILLRINDIGFGGLVPSQAVRADQITAAMAAAITKAKAKGLEAYAATLLPFKGAGYHSADGEAKRQAVNAFIRANRDVDGVIDFDKTMQNPADPLTINPAYDRGEHLHPNDAGYGNGCGDRPVDAGATRFDGASGTCNRWRLQ